MSAARDKRGSQEAFFDATRSNGCCTCFLQFAHVHGGRMTDVSMLGAFLAGLVSFLSPCVLPLVPGYVSMLSGIGMEQLRQGQQPRAGLFGSALSFVLGFSAVFITFGASASAVGQFLRQNRGLLAPLAAALIVLFGLHLIGFLAELSFRVGVVIGIVFVVLGFFAALQIRPLFSRLCPLPLFSR